MKPILLFLLLTGCASQPQRYMTQEQDAEMYENCKASGCVVIPIPIFKQMIERTGIES